MERKFSACNLIKQHVLILWAKKLVFHILWSHSFQNAEIWLWNRLPALNYTSSFVAPCYFVLPKTWLVQFPIKYFASYPVIVSTLKLIWTWWLQHTSTVSKSGEALIYSSDHTNPPPNKYTCTHILFTIFKLRPQFQGKFLPVMKMKLQSTLNLSWMQ